MIEPEAPTRPQPEKVSPSGPFEFETTVWDKTGEMEPVTNWAISVWYESLLKRSEAAPGLHGLTVTLLETTEIVEPAVMVAVDAVK